MGHYNLFSFLWNPHLFLSASDGRRNVGEDGKANKKKYRGRLWWYWNVKAVNIK
jgi:hypothetical protein